MNFRRIKNVARAIRRICSCPSREAIERARAMEQRMMLDDLTARVRASFTDEEWNAAKSRCEERLGFKIDVSTN